MNRQPAHITIKGKPLCDCEGHHAGLLGHRSPPVTYEHNGETFRLSCGYRSKAHARSAWREIAKVRYWKLVKVVPGKCPTETAEPAKPDNVVDLKPTGREAGAAGLNIELSSGVITVTHGDSGILLAHKVETSPGDWDKLIEALKGIGIKWLVS